MREDLSKTVVTGAYRRAAAALNQHGFVLLVGEPAAGKSTIARCWRWQPLINGTPPCSSSLIPAR
jgi:ABC-type phosphate/phosphonate transport system ATPase subunit